MEERARREFKKKAFYYSPHKSIKDSKHLYGVKSFLFEHYYEHLDEKMGYHMFNDILYRFSVEVLEFKGTTPNLEVAAFRIQKDFQKFRQWLDKNYTPDKVSPPNSDTNGSIDELQQEGKEDYSKETLSADKV